MDTHADSTAKARAAASPATRGRALLVFVAGLLLVVALFVAFAPALVSSSLGRGLLLGVVNDSLRGSITIDDLSLNWLSGQRARGVALYDPDGKPVARLEEFATELTLLQALRRQLSLGRTTIRGVNVDVIVDESGDSNLTRALASPEPATEPGGLLLPVTGNISLENSRISVAAPGVEPVVFDEVAGNVALGGGEQPLRIELKGRTRQGDSTGAFAITGEAADLVAADGALSPQTAHGKLDVDVQQFPVEGLDGLLGLRGTLSAALGRQANLVARATGTAEAQDLTVNARTPNLQLDLAGRLQQARFDLTRPANARFQVTPQLYDATLRVGSDDAALRLTGAFPVNLTLERLSFPTGTFNAGEIALRAGIDVEKPVELGGAADVGQIALRDLKLVVDSERLAEKISFTLDGSAVSGNKPGDLKVRGELAQLFDAKGAPQFDKLRANLSAKLSNLPTALIDQMAGQQGLLLDLLGGTLDLDADVKSTGGNQIDATLAVNAGPLATKGIAVSVTDSITLTQPARIRYRLSPQTVARLQGKDAGVILKRPASLALTIDSFKTPRPNSGGPVLQPGKTIVAATLTSEDLELSLPPEIDAVHIDGLRLDVTGESLSALQLRGAARFTDATASTKKFLTQLKASPLTIQFTAAGGLDDNVRLKPIAAALDLTSDGLAGQARLQVKPDFSAVALREPAALRMLVTAQLLTAINAVAPGQPNLTQPASVDIKLTQLDIPLADFSLAGVNAKGSARIDQLVLGGEAKGADAVLRDVKMDLGFDGARGASVLKLDAATALPAQQKGGALAIDAKLDRLLRNGALDLGNAQIKANAKITSLPSVLIETFSGQRGIAALVGESLDMDAALDSTGGGKQAGGLEIKARSQNLDLDAGLALGDELQLSRQARARLTLSPRAFDLLTAPSSGAPAKPGAGGYELAEDAAFDAVLSELRWPLAGADGKAVFDPARAGISATMSAPQLVFRERATGQKVVLKQLKAALNGPRLDKPVNVDLNAQVEGAAKAASTTGSAGALRMSAQAADLFTAKGEFNSDGLSLSTDGQLQQLPVALLDQVLALDGLAVATLGAAADVTFNTRLARMTGPLNLQLRSNNANADIDADLRKEGLVLRKPLLAEVQATEAFGKQVLAKIHPVFEGLQSSTGPVRIEVPQQGVVIPLKDFRIERVAIPQMKLDPGKLTLKSGWLLNGLIGLAQQFGVYSSSGKDRWSAWFTPAVFKMADGKVVYARRMDVLLDERLHLATWGTADIANDRADLVFAFMPETLTKVFRLPTAPGDALRIPVRGPLSKPSVDFSKAALDLGRLRAQKKAVEKDPLTGALLGAVTRSVTGGAPIPPASVDPLPWGALPEPEGVSQTGQPRQTAPPAPRTKTPEEQAVEGLFDLLRKKK